MPSSLGPAEILVILIVALIVLGPNKLPGAARQVGKTLSEVRKWSQGFQDEIRSAIDPDASPPSYPPPVAAPSETPPPAPPGGPATPADSEYKGPTPETAPPYGAHPVRSPDSHTSSPAGTEAAAPAGSNGSAPHPDASEPSEPPAGELPQS